MRQLARPFTLIAAVIFGLMALVHVYRIVTHFQIIVGSHPMPMAVSWIALVVTGAAGGDAVPGKPALGRDARR